MLLRFFIIVALVFGMTLCAFGRQVRVNTEAPWPYHPNRPGVEAYMQGGAFVATTGSVTSMLFNPAGLAQLPGRFVATVESGWASESDFVSFFDIKIASGFQPVQFAAFAFKPSRNFSLGVYYARPTHYDLDFPRIPILTIDHPEGTGEFIDAASRREQFSLGLSLALPLRERFSLGGGVEWQRASLRDEIWHTVAEGDGDAVRFAIGAILQVNDWNMGIAAQTNSKVSGDVTFEDSEPLVQIDPQVDPVRNNNNARLIARPEQFGFSHEEPATIRFGLATPYVFGRLRLSADAEYKDFNSEYPIERWQFYGGGIFRLASNVDLGFGAFTFAKDYSAYIDGSESETFWTVGVAIELAQFRLSASFMDGDLFTQNFSGQQFVNFAVSFVVP
jgi:hypothetical protein